MTVRSRLSSTLSRATSAARKSLDQKIDTLQQSTFSGFSFSTNKAIGTCIWLIGAWLTVNTLLQLGIPETTATVGGIALQLALTRAERQIWRGGGISKFAICALIVDTAVNSAGVWPYSKNIGSTDFWSMVKDVMVQPDAVPNTTTMITMSVLVGLATAYAAEYYWNLP